MYEMASMNVDLESFLNDMNLNLNACLNHKTCGQIFCLPTSFRAFHLKGERDGPKWEISTLKDNVNEMYYV